MRKCIKCEELKENSFFHKNNRNKDGLERICKNCRKIISASFYEKHKDSLREKDAKRYWCSPKRQQDCKSRAKAHRTKDIENSRLKDKIRAAKLESRFSRAKCDARKRNLAWELTFEEFSELAIQSCHYCNNELGPKTKFGTNIDRINNKIGYVMDNVVPCCFFCNSLRRGVLTKEEMEVAAEAIIKLRKKNK